MTRATSTAEPAWVSALRAIGATAGGGLSVVPITPGEIKPLREQAAAGDRRAQQLVGGALAMCRVVVDAPADRPVRCACCARDVTAEIFTIVLVFRRGDYAAGCASFGICTGCAIRFEDIERKAAAAVRRVLPQFRRFSPTTSQGGNA